MIYTLDSYIQYANLMNDSMFQSTFDDCVREVSDSVGDNMYYIDPVPMALIKIAACARLAAGYSGSSGDNGAGQLLAEAIGHVCGSSGRSHARYAAICEVTDDPKMADPEYRVFIRLKKKFEK